MARWVAIVAGIVSLVGAWVGPRLDPLSPMQDSKSGHSVAFRSFCTGASFSNVGGETPEIVVVRKESELERLGRLLTKEGRASIDPSLLKEEVLLLVVSSRKNSTGHEIVVVNVQRQDGPGRLRLEIREISDVSSGKGGDPALTFPYAIISIPRKEFSDEITCTTGDGKLWQATVHKEFQVP